MSDANIVPLRRPGDFPRAEVLDLAVSVAIGRNLASSEDEMASLLEHWFLRPATRSDLLASVARLISWGWIDRSSDAEFDYSLTEEGALAATNLSGGMIRMIDRGEGIFKTAYLLQASNLEQGKCP